MRLFKTLIFSFLSAAGFAQTDMIIYQNYGPLIVHALADIDTITYTEGTLGTAPIIETLPPATGFGPAALSGGVISHTGGTSISERGICWSTGPNPTLNDQVNSVDGGDYFVAAMTNLSLDLGLEYYVRAFAINETDTAYGNQQVLNVGYNACGATTSVTDQDGNIYEVVSIGQQCWFASNLKVSVFSNGDPLNEITELDLNDIGLGDPSYMWYELDNTYDDVYGKFYNQTAIDDSRDICPTGWKVPTKADWEEMFEFIEPGFTYTDDYIVENVGGALKAVSEYWTPPNEGASDAVGFGALPTGALYLLADDDFEEAYFSFLGLGELTRFGFKNSVNDQTSYFVLYGETSWIEHHTIGDLIGYVQSSVRCIKE